MFNLKDNSPVCLVIKENRYFSKGAKLEIKNQRFGESMAYNRKRSVIDFWV